MNLTDLAEYFQIFFRSNWVKSRWGPTWQNL